jgi:hypothetical protein
LSAVKWRRSFVGSVSNHFDSPRRPHVTCASSHPIQMSCGREVPRKTCGNPAALFVMRSEFRVPGPHHRFSVENPSATFQRSIRA